MEIIIFIGQIIIGLLILTFLVVIHELGHAIVARRNGVVVEEFGIGFPPRAWSKKLKNKVRLSINWLPLGGFVKLQGENDQANKKGDYGATSLWVKAKILLAGVTMNWLFAILAFTILAFVGFPKVIPNQFTVPADTKEVTTPLKVALVEKGSPAQKIGLKINDEIISINGQKITNPEDLPKITSANQGKSILLKYKTDDKQRSVNVQLLDNPQKRQGSLGVATVSQTTRYSTWSAPIVGIGTTVQFSGATLQGLGDLIAKLTHGLATQLSSDQETRKAGSQEVSDAGDSVGGPLSIIGVFFPAAQKAGLATLLFLTAVISLTLAVINVLPIPALDGGRLFLALLFRAIKKPLTKDIEETIVGYSFIGLIGLIIIITIADVFKIQSL